MNKLTEDQREILDGELADLSKIVDLLWSQIRPTMDAIRLLEASRDGILEKHGVHCSFDDLEKCEGCGAYILEGDKAFRYDDGPSLCETHAPTWSDLKKSLEGDLSITAADDTEERERIQESLKAIDTHIAAGDGDKKHVW